MEITKKVVLPIFTGNFAIPAGNFVLTFYFSPAPHNIANAFLLFANAEYI
jgi:hypothetical protein